MSSPAGWFPDPADSSRWRWWDGNHWASDAVGSTGADSAKPLIPVPEKRLIVRRFITDQFEQGLLTDDQHRWLEARIEEWTPASDQRVAQPPPPPPPPPLSAAGDLPVAAEPLPTSELVIRVLTLLGMTLFFVGVIGFVVFAFGDVGQRWRPLAEVLVPFSLFASAPAFRRLGAPFVAMAVVFAGGITTPIMGAAALVDNATPPPDPHGRVLAGMLLVLGLVITAGYAIVATRRPTSALRYLVGPMAWLSAAAGGLLFVDNLPGGRDTFGPRPSQWAIVAWTIALTALIAERRGERILAKATRPLVVPGAVVAFAIAWSSAAATGMPFAPVFFAGAATILTVEIMCSRLGTLATTLIQTLTILVVTASAFPTYGLARPAGVAVVALLLTMEWESRRRADATSSTTLALAGALTVLPTFADSHVLLVIAIGLLLWGVARRFIPAEGIPSSIPLAAVWYSTALAVLATSDLVPVDVTLIITGGAGVVASSGARLARSSRIAQDRLTASWILAISLGSVSFVALDFPGRPGAGVIAAALGCIALAFAPQWPTVRAWSAVFAGAVAAAWGSVLLGLDASTGIAGIAVIGLALLAVVHLRPVSIAGHLALAGLATTVICTAICTGFPTASDGPWPWTATIGLLATAAGFVIIEFSGRAGHSPVQDLLDGWFDTPSDSMTGSAVPRTALDFRAMEQVLVVISTLLATISLVASINPVSPVLPWGLASGSSVALVAVLLGRHLGKHTETAGFTYTTTGWWSAIALSVVTATVAVPTGPDHTSLWAPPIATLVLIGCAVALGPELETWHRVIAWAAAVIVWFQIAYTADIGWTDIPMTIAFVVMSVVATVGAARTERGIRHLLQALSATAVCFAWLTLVAGLELRGSTAVIAWSALGSVAFITLAVATRIRRLRRDWIPTWSWFPTAAVAVSVVESFLPNFDTGSGRIAAAIGVATVATGIGLLATPLQLDLLRSLCTVLLAAAGWTALSAFDMPSARIVVISSLLAIGSSAAGVALGRLKGTQWLPALVTLSLLESVVAIGVAFAAVSTSTTRVTALTTLAVVLAGTGVSRRQTRWTVMAVIAAAAAWTEFALRTLSGDPQWFSVPYGLALLACVGLLRSERRRAGQPMKESWLTALDILGMVFVVSASIVATRAGSMREALIGFAAGSALIAFGIATKVRRRLLFGAATVAAISLLLVVPPLLGLVPVEARWFPWVILIVVGLGAIVLAALVERGRTAIRNLRTKFSDLTSGWE